jgi:hypothetical protein
MLYLIVLLAVIVGVIWALVVFPSFRVVAVILVGLSMGAYVMVSEKTAQEQKQQELKKEQERATFEAEQKAYCEAEKRRWAIVPASQIEIRDPSLSRGQFWDGNNDNYAFTASAKNKSKSKVTGLRLNVTALDCPTQDARPTDCDIVGHSDGTFDADIPTGEVREINGRVTLRDVPKPRGVFSPRFAVSGVRAAIDQSDITHSDLLAEWELSGYKCH